MCGIGGQFRFRGDRPVERASIEAMAHAIAHRGPDDDGYLLRDGLGLGFRRLSIIDLQGGHQPMSDPDGRVWVAFNGEIYNFVELRAELRARGRTFRTRSDTEVLVHGYAEWGTGVLDRLNGMFGVAIWDEDRRRLVLARDSAGIKPLYYHVDGGAVLFGSEIRAILAALDSTPALDLEAVDLFLRFRYTPSPLTIHEGIRKLAPGTMAVFEAGDWRVERWIAPPDREPAPATDAAAADELLERYRRAVRRHLITDVPLGLLLSGGVDSGLLLALMAEHGSDWPTYTAGYAAGEYAHDELAAAAATAGHYGSPNAPVVLDRDRFAESLEHVVRILEEPVAASSIVPMYHVCERARRDVKVALVGQGPDELFGGYRRHLGIRYGGGWRRTPAWLRAGIAGTIERLPRAETLRRGVQALGTADALARYRDAFSILPRAEVDALFRPEFRPRLGGDDVCELWAGLVPEMQGADELGRFQVIELRSSLPDELLLYADKLSMAHGLEVRVPFLDREIVEYAARLPAPFKVRWGRGKWLHRRVCERFLPREILARPKRGFAVDAVDAWLRSTAAGLGDRLLDADARIYEFLEPRAVRALYEAHRGGRRDAHKMLFSLIVLETWLRANAAAPSPRPALLRSA